MDAKEANRRSRQGQKAAIGHEPALQQKYLQVLRANARRVSQAYVSRAAAPVTAAALVAAGGVPDDPHVAQPGLDAVLEEGVLAASASARTKAERQRIAEAAAHPIISEAGKRELRLLLADIVAAQAGVQAERLVQGVRDTVAQIMLEALVEGWTVPQTASVLQATLELDAEWRATMLARTDLIALSNAASLKAVSTLEEPPLYKTWLTAGDDRVRPEHVDANRQTVRVDEPYHVGGSKLMYPGDPSGPDDLVINCRCVSIFTDLAHPALEHTDAGGIHDDPVTEFDAPLTAGAQLDALCASVLWDESRHPRHPQGEREGGRFASSGAAIPAVPADVVGDVHDYQLEQAAGYARAHGMTPDEYLAASGEWLRGQVAGEEVRIRAPVEAIGPIVDAGQMVPGGEATFGGEWGRDRLEETYMGDGGQPPVYGYVSGIPEDDGHPVTMYGDAVIRLTPEASARASVTLGDSANTLTDPTREAPPFAPVPFVQPSAQAIDFDTAGDVLSPGLGLRDFTGVYPEAQVWGGVKLADVREVVYTDGYVPDGAVQEKLRSAGVQWRTVDGQDPVPLLPEHRPQVGQTYQHRTWLDDGAPAEMTVTGDYGTGVTWRLPQDTSDRGSSYRSFLHEAGQDLPAVTAAVLWDESKHPRHHAGEREGGRFAAAGTPVDDRALQQWVADDVEGLRGIVEREDADPDAVLEGYRQQMLARYHEEYDRGAATIEERLAGQPAVIEARPPSDGMALSDPGRHPGGSFSVGLPDDPAANFTVFTDTDGSLAEWQDGVADVLDPTDPDFFPPGDSTGKAGRYVAMVRAVRGDVVTGDTHLYRGMSPAEFDAWGRGDPIPVGKFFTSQPTASMAADVQGEFPTLYDFQVANADVVETDPGVYQVIRPVTLNGSRVAASHDVTAAVLWDETAHPRHPGGEREGGRFAPKLGATGTPAAQARPPKTAVEAGRRVAASVLAKQRAGIDPIADEVRALPIPEGDYAGTPVYLANGGGSIYRLPSGSWSADGAWPYDPTRYATADEALAAVRAKLSDPALEEDVAKNWAKRLRGGVMTDGEVLALHDQAGERNATSAAYTEFERRWGVDTTPVVLLNEKGMQAFNKDVLTSGFYEPGTGVVYLNADSTRVGLDLLERDRAKPALAQRGYDYGTRVGKMEAGAGSAGRTVDGLIRHETAHAAWARMPQAWRDDFTASVPADYETRAQLTRYSADAPEVYGEEMKGADAGLFPWQGEVFAETAAATMDPEYDPADWPAWVNDLGDRIKAARP